MNKNHYRKKKKINTFLSSSCRLDVNYFCGLWFKTRASFQTSVLAADHFTTTTQNSFHIGFSAWHNIYRKWINN